MSEFRNVLTQLDLKERAGPAGASIYRTTMLTQARIGVSRRLDWVYTEAERTGLGEAVA